MIINTVRAGEEYGEEGESRFSLSSPLITSEDAALYLQCHPRTLAEWRMNGEGPKYYRVGRRAFYKLPDLESWLESRAVANER